MPNMAAVLNASKVMSAIGDCPWMRVAIRELGQLEVPGRDQHNQRIMSYHSIVGIHQGDETPWCSSFANWCVSTAGFQGSGKASARSWLRWGDPLATSTPVFGCVAVFKRGHNPIEGHVGFLVGETPNHIMLLGGNQRGALSRTGEVCVKPYSKKRLIGFRWPSGHPLSAQLRHLVAEGSLS
jgi:uncharacterized protein (TIGR02594 family)